VRLFRRRKEWFLMRPEISKENHPGWPNTDKKGSLPWILVGERKAPSCSNGRFVLRGGKKEKRSVYRQRGKDDEKRGMVRAEKEKDVFRHQKKRRARSSGDKEKGSRKAGKKSKRKTNVSKKKKKGKEKPLLARSKRWEASMYPAKKGSIHTSRADESPKKKPDC